MIYIYIYLENDVGLHIGLEHQLSLMIFLSVICEEKVARSAGIIELVQLVLIVKKLSNFILSIQGEKNTDNHSLLKLVPV